MDNEVLFLLRAIRSFRNQVCVGDTPIDTGTFIRYNNLVDCLLHKLDCTFNNVGGRDNDDINTGDNQ